MSLGRRAFVAGAAGAAVAGLHAGPAAARIWPAQADPVLLLLDPAAPPDFATAAGRALAAVGLAVTHRVTGEDGHALAASVAWLAAQPGRRMLGLLQDADAVLLDQMARDGALRCLSSAQHCRGVGGDAPVRHRITALPSNAGLLAGERAANGGGWSAALGQALALIAAERWPGRTQDATGGGAGAGPYALRSFVFAS